jgi:hypothetical protein
MSRNSVADAEAEAILKKIAADFEQLGQEIDRAIAALSSDGDSSADIEALRRAKEAVRKGAALAAKRSKFG